MSAGHPQDATAELTKGAVVGPYKIESLLGVGGMGRVYEAVGPDGDHVALKVVKRDLARDTVFRRRFAREAGIAQRVEHRHVVPVVDQGEHDGIPYLAQRFIRGGSLAETLERDGHLEVETAVRICLWVASGLDAVHAAGLIHRDVKPGNILLDEEGVAYITDFGLAKDSQGTVLTRPGQALGSLDYMAPEQIRSDPVTGAADVYALGCVMCELPHRPAAVRRPPGHARALGPPPGRAARPVRGPRRPVRGPGPHDQDGAGQGPGRAPAHGHGLRAHGADSERGRPRPADLVRARRPADKVISFPSYMDAFLMTFRGSRATRARRSRSARASCATCCRRRPWPPRSRGGCRGSGAAGRGGR